MNIAKIQNLKIFTRKMVVIMKENGLRTKKKVKYFYKIKGIYIILGLKKGTELIGTNHLITVMSANGMTMKEMVRIYIFRYFFIFSLVSKLSIKF